MVLLQAAEVAPTSAEVMVTALGRTGAALTGKGQGGADGDSGGSADEAMPTEALR